MSSLNALFDGSLVGHGERPALEWGRGDGSIRSMTFAEVNARAARMATELAARGVGAGDRLAVQLPNGLEFLDLFLACLRLGVVFVPVNVLYRERELRHIVADSGPKAVIVAPEAAPSLPAGTVVWNTGALGDGASHRSPMTAPPEIDDEAPALIIYTSGTTGAAKGAVLSHGNLAANGTNVVTAWHITEADRYLAVLPLFHVHGLGNGVHAWLISGCLMRLHERFDHRQAAQHFANFRPSLFFGVPTIYHRLLDPAVVPPAAADAIGKNARLFVSGSAPLPAHVLEAFRRRFGHTILERYGMTEALMIATNPYDAERRPGTVGRAFPGVSVRVVNERDEPVEDGAIGEVQVRSRALFAGYWRNPEATASAFADGWFRTGDLGVRSADGYLTLRGRKGDLIISGGFNIYPREIEEVLLEDECVREAAVVGAPDELRGEVPIAYVVVSGEVDAAHLERRCRQQLASFKVPRAFIAVDALPRTALGKVQKHLLPSWRPSADRPGDRSPDSSRDSSPEPAGE